MSAAPLKALYYNALRFTGVTTFARRLARGGVVLCYHNVLDRPDGTADRLGLHMSLAAFERQMRWLAAHYAVVPLEEFVSRLLRGRSLRGVAAVTFDDAYEGVFAYAWPLLRDLRLPATVFVVADAPAAQPEGFWWDNPEVLRAYSPDQEQRWLTAFKGDRTSIVESVAPNLPWHAPPGCRPATWQAITTAADAGLHIGAHSVTHRALPALNEADLHREVSESREIIRRHTGVTPVLFAYPYGLWNDRVRHAVQSAGYHAAFTLAPDSRAPTGDAWTLPRVNVPANIEHAALEAWTAGLSFRGRHGA
jgi:peptidoglycan/xylan/chitin deacetylase (PgdA/CDA1 family)